MKDIILCKWFSSLQEAIHQQQSNPKVQLIVDN